MNYCVLVILETTDSYKMSTIEESGIKRGTAEIMLQYEIRHLRKVCEVEPNKRLVAKWLASIDTAIIKLIEAHVDLVIETNAQLEEPRFTQYIDRWVDAANEVKAVAEDILEAVDEEDYKQCNTDYVQSPQNVGSGDPGSRGRFCYVRKVLPKNHALCREFPNYQKQLPIYKVPQLLLCK